MEIILATSNNRRFEWKNNENVGLSRDKEQTSFNLNKKHLTTNVLLSRTSKQKLKTFSFFLKKALSKKI